MRDMRREHRQVSMSCVRRADVLGALRAAAQGRHRLHGQARSDDLRAVELVRREPPVAGYAPDDDPAWR